VQLGNRQISILTCLVTTALLGCWFAVLRTSMVLGCITLPYPLVLSYILYRRSAAPLLSLVPLTFCGLAASHLAGGPVSPLTAMISLAVACTISTVYFALQSTRKRYQNSASHDWAILATSWFTALAGVASGAVLSVPFAIYQNQPIAIVGFPILGFLAGLILGIPLGFVGDAFVVRDARHRRSNKTPDDPVVRIQVPSP
jgi:hypothetical protein